MNKQYDNFSALEDGELVDIYFDGVRFLPDNVSITKLVVRVVDGKLNNLNPKTEKLAEFSSTFRNQNYNLKI